MTHRRNSLTSLAKAKGLWRLLTAWWLIPSMSNHRTVAAFQTPCHFPAVQSRSLVHSKQSRTFRHPPAIIAHALPSSNGKGPAARSQFTRSRGIRLDSTSDSMSYFDETWGHLLDYEVRLLPLPCGQLVRRLCMTALSTRRGYTA
jgi:hypothetical protein